MASPHRIFTETDLVLASHNAGKLREISALFEGRPFQVTSAADHDVPEPEETEDSFIGNAVLKARHTVEAAMQKVNSSLAATGGADRRAYFTCVLALAWPDGHHEVFEGRVDGDLIWPPRGDRGFGYDPMFVARGYDLTFGEMDPQEKLDIGHRADAFAKLVAACFP